MGDIIAFQAAYKKRDEGKAKAHVLFSDNFLSQTCIQQSHGILVKSPDENNIAEITIDGEEFPIRVHVQDYRILS